VPLFTERLRRQRLAEHEAAGEVLWTETISERARVTVAQLWANVINAINAKVVLSNGGEAQLARMILDSVRWSTGSDPACVTPDQLARSKADTPQLLDVFEALYEAIETIASKRPHVGPLSLLYQDRLNEALNAHRVAYKMIRGRFVPFSDDPVYAATIEPTVRLLIDRRFDRAQAAFLNALREIQNGKADDAITDAGTALQETLVALGCQGDVLGRLIQDARGRDLLAGHDEKLQAGIFSFLNWASADRSQTGDAHKQSDATIGDAWLAVHVIGALIVRLASDDPRVPTPAKRRR
jgi:hypothetical protein